MTKRLDYDYDYDYDYEWRRAEREGRMAKTLRAMILGSGYAGQGHAQALRECGVEIAAMASRTEEVVRRVAAEMGIPVASTDWRATLAEVRPEIVAVGTPGGTHVEMVGAALAAGCHVLCDKPLATTARERG